MSKDNVNSGVCPDHRRLDRIEEKIDRLSDIIVTLARAEERLIGLEEDKRDVYKSIDDIESRLGKLEQSVVLNSKTVDSLHKLIWVLLSGVLTAIIAYTIQ
jgi:low affinity Fe/Cu permease